MSMFYQSSLPITAAAIFLTAFAVTAVLVAFTIWICRTNGWVVKPRADRWHQGTPAFFGGVPIWLAVVSLSAVFVPFSNRVVWTVIGISSLIFALGVVDDIFHLRPRSKFVVQLLAAAGVLACGVVYPLRESLVVNLAVSLLWLVGITNAFNLLDNMDGLSAGIALISAVYLVLFYLTAASRDYLVLVSLLAGCIAGFLLFNFKPARIFMGDGGSLFIGFLLGSVSLLEVTHVSGVPALVFSPVIVLAIPIFDTFFVSVTRRMRGQPVSQGGTDHSSHRLVRLGLHERSAVLLLYALTAGSGAVALAVRHLVYSRAIGIIALWFLFLFLFGIHLFRDESQQAAHSDAVRHPLLSSLLVQDTLALLLDPVALSLSYYLAYSLRFRAEVAGSDSSLFLRSWWIVVIAKFVALWLCKIYRHSWWRGSVGDVYRLARAILIGETLAIMFLVGMYRFNGYSRFVFLIDALVSWGLLLGVRRSFGFFRESMYRLGSRTGAERRVFVLGTSEHTELALRFLRGRRIDCVGLIDTNGGSDLGRSVWGAQVVGRLEDLIRLANDHGVTEIVLPENEVVPYSEPDFQNFCRRADLRLMKLGLYTVHEEREPSGAAKRASAHSPNS